MASVNVALSVLLWDMHTIFPDNVYADGNSFRCMAHNGTHTYKDCPLFSIFSNWIHLIEWMPSMEKKGLIVLFFLLWNCPLFLGHRLWWTLECVNEFPVNSSLCGSRLCHTHTHTLYVLFAVPLLGCPYEGELWDCWHCQIAVCWRRTFKFV